MKSPTEQCRLPLLAIGIRLLVPALLAFIADQRDPREADEIVFPSFATGLRIARIVDAIAASARAGGRWKTIRP